MDSLITINEKCFYQQVATEIIAYTYFKNIFNFLIYKLLSQFTDYGYGSYFQIAAGGEKSSNFKISQFCHFDLFATSLFLVLKCWRPKGIDPPKFTRKY